METATLENKEIKGITLKHLIVLVSFLVSILITVVGIYFKITTSLDKHSDRLNLIDTRDVKSEAIMMKLMENQILYDKELLKTQMENLYLKTRLKGAGVIDKD